MLEVKVNSEKLQCSLQATGTVKDLFVEICMVINGIYSSMHKGDRLMAEEFRRDLRGVVSGADSPLWETDAQQGDGFVMTMPVKREGKDNG